MHCKHRPITFTFRGEIITKLVWCKKCGAIKWYSDTRWFYPTTYG